MNASNNSTVLITGATSGIGYGLAEHYLKKGDRVVACGRKLGTLSELKKHYAEQLYTIAFDTTDRTDCSAAREMLQKDIGAIDTVILSAGTCEYMDANNLDTELFERVMQVNCQGMMNSLWVVQPLLKQAQKNRPECRPYVLGVSSLATTLPFTRSQAYRASKAAVTSMLECLRVDWYELGWDVSIVNPGFVKTPLTDQNDFSMPMRITVDEAVTAIVKGMQKRRLSINFPTAFSGILHTLKCLPMAWQCKLMQKMKND